MEQTLECCWISHIKYIKHTIYTPADGIYLTVLFKSNADLVVIADKSLIWWMPFNVELIWLHTVLSFLSGSFKDFPIIRWGHAPDEVQLRTRKEIFYSLDQ